MNVGIGTVAAQFLFWTYMFGIFGIASLQCSVGLKKKIYFYHAGQSLNECRFIPLQLCACLRPMFFSRGFSREPVRLKRELFPQTQGESAWCEGIA
jgi:hypothetical protein